MKTRRAARIASPPASTFALVNLSVTPEATGRLVTRGTVPGFSRGQRPLGLSQSTYFVLRVTTNA
jgi:hypothetical protein